MNAPEIIQTKRLILRKPCMEDTSVIFQAYAQDPEVTRYLVWKPHQHVSETEAFLERCLTVWKEGSSYPYVITRQGSDAPIGMLEIHNKAYKVEVGYALARPHWGKGLMSEVMQTVVAWALEQPEIFRVQSFCDVDNVGSARVMEKAGMIREGLLRRYIVHPNVSDEPRDVYLYSIVK